MRPLVITIDGPAGSGKSTVARRVATLLSCTLLDTGAIYRALALRAQQRGVSWEDGPQLALLAAALDLAFSLEGDVNRVSLDGQDVSEAIRTPSISGGASQVSAIPAVRAALLDLQRGVALQGDLVTEGRDMGTVVFPEAEVKVFLEADPVIRARRRQQELIAAGSSVSLEEVLEQQTARDEADSGRAVAPLRPAVDARKIDTSTLEIEEVVQAVLGLVEARTAAMEA
jgi:cytidylate kinase